MALVAVITLAASALVFSFFSPQFVLWQSWRLAPEFFYSPAVGRGAAVLWQQDHLGSKVPDEIHQIVRWRVAIPGIARLLSLPAGLHLALYPLGAILAAWFAVRVLIARKASWPTLLAASVAFVANDWFFTSTRWLGYGDGWVVFGLLVVAFSDCWWLVLLVGILAPWVDDRFLMAFPLTLATRFFDERTFVPQGESRGLFLSPRFLFAALVGPAVSVVLRILLESSPATRSTEGIGFPPIRGHEWDFVRGAWSAWRFTWLALPACWVSLWPALAAGRVPAVMIAGYGALAFLSVAAGMVTAYDTSRAGLVIAPLILVGLRFFATSTGSRVELRYCVGGIALANLLLPTSHVIVGITDTIRSLPTELSMLRHPPPDFNARYHAARSLAAAQKGDGQQAALALAVAERLRPNDHEVVAARAFFTAVHSGGDTAIRILVRRCQSADDFVLAAARLQELLLDAGEHERARAIAASLESLTGREPVERAPVSAESPKGRHSP
jgi:hypothetical protein